MSTRPLALPGVVLVVLSSLVAAGLTGAVQTGAAAVDQSGTTSLSAPNVQPGGRPAASSKAKLKGTVRFSPARQGRPVLIQRKVEDLLDPLAEWKTVATKKQNGSGAVTFTGPATTSDGQPYSYRGVAKATGSLSAFPSAAQSTDVWEPVFADEFSGTSLSDQWRDRRPDSKECAKVGDPRARKVAKGTLRLSVKLDPAKKGRKCKVRGYGTFRHYLNGQVSTSHLEQRFTPHSTLSARIKFHKNRGAHGAFWMQPFSPDSGAIPRHAGAEIDIAEFFGKGYNGGGLASFLYNYAIRKHGEPVKIGGLAPSATRMLPKRDAWWKRFHVFSLEWTENAYTFSVDGRTHSVIKRGVTTAEEYVILGLMTSAWELKQAKRQGVSPVGTMQVDWVRVWKKN